MVIRLGLWRYGVMIDKYKKSCRKFGKKKYKYYLCNQTVSPLMGGLEVKMIYWQTTHRLRVRQSVWEDVTNVIFWLLKSGKFGSNSEDAQWTAAMG